MPKNKINVYASTHRSITVYASCNIPIHIFAFHIPSFVSYNNAVNHKITFQRNAQWKSHLEPEHLWLNEVKWSSINFHQATASLAVRNSRRSFLQDVNHKYLTDTQLVHVMRYINLRFTYLLTS